MEKLKKEESSVSPPTRPIEIISGTMEGIVFETIWKDNKSAFAYADGNGIKIAKILKGNPITFIPPQNCRMIKDIITLPTDVEDCGSEAEILAELRGFIHNYAEVQPFFEMLLAYYVLLSWCYDEFDTLPYLTITADLGSGKSRLGIILKELCYHGLIINIASTISPILRLSHKWKTTLILDEAHMLNGDNDKILEFKNLLYVGNDKNARFLRSDDKKNSFEPMAFNVFGPKIMLSRERINDEALESRTFKIPIAELTRKDIPLNLSSEFYLKGQALRNKLIYWRLNNYGKRRARMDESLKDERFRSRWSQLLQIIFCVAESEEDKKEILEYGNEMAGNALKSRSITFEADIVVELLKCPTEEMLVSDLREAINKDRDQKQQISPQRLGFFLSNKLEILSYRKGHERVVWINVAEGWKNIKQWAKNLGIEDIPEDPPEVSQTTMKVLTGKGSEKTPDIPF